MATLAQIRDKVDTFLADLWVNKIVPKQEAYFAQHGRYAQVLISPTTPLEDGAEGTFELRPAHYEQFIADFTFTIDVPIPMQIEIHQHQRGNEFGFTAFAWVVVNGKTYRRAKNYQFGHDDEPWREMPIT